MMTKEARVWEDGCKELFLNQTTWLPGNITDGLIDQYGHPMDRYDSQKTWGITRETCYKYCGPSKLHEVGYVDL